MGKDNKSVLTIRVPASLKDRIEKFAVMQGVSINQFALYTFTKELAELETSEFFRNELKHSKKDIIKRFDTIFDSISDREVSDWDSVAESSTYKKEPQGQKIYNNANRIY